MNLYLLTPVDPQSGPWDPWYDRVFGMVVRAPSSLGARKIAAKEGYGDEGAAPWLAAHLTHCQKIGKAKHKKAGLVLVSARLAGTYGAELDEMREKNAELVQSDIDKLRDVQEGETLAHYRKQSEEQARIIYDLQERLHATEKKLAATALVIDDYSDMLALARRFVSTAEQAGIKTRHVRAKKVRT